MSLPLQCVLVSEESGWMCAFAKMWKLLLRLKASMMKTIYMYMYGSERCDSGPNIQFVLNIVERFAHTAQTPVLLRQFLQYFPLIQRRGRCSLVLS